jgi:tripartite-type tricarboxylate transporter receptor subunit TctC
MRISRRSLVTALAAAPFASLLPRIAQAAYPDRSIRLIVPFAAGGNADFVARLVGEGMSQALGQSVVVENRTGAGGSLGAAVVATEPPDGYTLLTGSNGPLTVNPFVQAKLGYDPLTDFVAIGLASITPHVIVLHESTPARTVPELIALSKKQSVTIGTSGVGSATHMTLARFSAATGATLTHVPYRGGGALVPDVLAGTIAGAVTEMSTALPHHNQGKVRILAVASAKRLPQAADVPTMIESGVKDFTAASYVGVLAPAKTPPEIVALLEKTMIGTMADKVVQDKFLASGAELVSGVLQTSKGFGDYIKDEYARAKEAAKIAGLKPE